jgi:hypothetical protein
VAAYDGGAEHRLRSQITRRRPLRDREADRGVY